jgi:hypothetical protein
MRLSIASALAHHRLKLCPQEEAPVPTNLTQAHRQLFARPDDERFESLGSLWEYCHQQKTQSTDRWTPPSSLKPESDGSRLRLTLGSDGAFALNHWSFSQLCTMCGVSRDTLNRLSPDTASRALSETLPGGTKPLQILSTDHSIRSIHGVTYFYSSSCFSRV